MSIILPVTGAGERITMIIYTGQETTSFVGHVLIGFSPIARIAGKPYIMTIHIIKMDMFIVQIATIIYLQSAITAGMQWMQEIQQKLIPGNLYVIIALKITTLSAKNAGSISQTQTKKHTKPASFAPNVLNH